jgi:hypothetical protein
MTDHAPLTEDELHQDAIGSYYEATAEIGDRVRAGDSLSATLARKASTSAGFASKRKAGPTVTSTTRVRSGRGSLRISSPDDHLSYSARETAPPQKDKSCGRSPACVAGER